jgi:hypothetical protein
MVGRGQEGRRRSAGNARAGARRLTCATD